MTDRSAGWRAEYAHQHCPVSIEEDSEDNHYASGTAKKQQRLTDAKDTADEKCRVTSTTAAVSNSP